MRNVDPDGEIYVNEYAVISRDPHPFTPIPVIRNQDVRK